MQCTRKERHTTATSMTILVMALSGSILGFSRNAAAAVPPVVRFSTTANSISGSAVKTTRATQERSDATVVPLALTKTVTLGFDQATLDSATRSIFGVDVYNFANVNNTTTDAPSGVRDAGETDTVLGAGSLLGELITWRANTSTMTCIVDAHIALQINCDVSGSTEGLTINGVAVGPAGNFPEGVAIPVTGPVSDSQCFGAETFTGTLTPLEVRLLGDETTRPVIVLTGLHLVGDATCRAPAIDIFTTHYDLTIGDHTLDQHEKSGVGDLNVVFKESGYSIVP
jgi:hypothetical protein